VANVVANIVVNAQVMGAVRNLNVLQKSLNDINKTAVFSPAALKAQQAWTAAAAQGAVASGQFSARMVPVVDQVGRFNTALERGTMSLGQYAKYTAAAAASQTRFRNIFRDTNLITKVAEANVRQLGTQYSLLGKSATGANQALALTPRYLNSMSAATQVAIEKQRIMHQLFRQGNAALLNWGKNTQWAGRQLMVGFTLPLTIFAGVAAKTFRDLEKQAINFRKVYGDIFTTRAEVEENLSAVKDLAKEYTRFGVAVKDTMELAAIAAQAGQRGAQLQSATEEATRLSVLGQMDSQDAMRATIALQSAFGLSSDKLTESINFMNMVNNSTVLSLQDMAEAIPRVAPVIRGLGGDVREMAVLLTAMREGGVSAAEAANGLKSSLGRLIAPSKQAREVAKAFGISLEEIVQVNRGDLLGTITDLSKAMEKLQDLEKQQLLSAVFGKFQFARMGALFSNITREGSQAQVVMERLGMSAQELAGIAEKELGAIEESASTKFTAALEQLKLSIVPIGEAFLKAITPIAEFFTKIMNFFDGLGAGTKNTIMMGVALVAIIGPITMLVGLFANAVSQILNFGRLMLKFRAILMGNGAAWRTYTSAEREAIASNASLGSTTESVTAKMLLNRQAADILAVTYNKLAGAAIGAASAIARIPGAGGAAARAGSAAAGRFNRGGDVEAEKAFATKRIFASGGNVIVPGIGNKDTVPAILTPGEFVVNKQSTKEYRPILELINSGKPLPAMIESQDNYQMGGTIPPTRPAQLSVARFNTGDSVPAMLTPGEFVVNRSAAQSNIDILEAINSGDSVMRLSMGGKIPRYSKGGRGVKPEFLHMDEPRAATKEEIKAAQKYSADARVGKALEAGKTPSMYSNLGIMGPASFNVSATGKQMAALFDEKRIQKTMMPFYRAYAQAVAGSGVTVTEDMFKEALKDPKSQQSIRSLSTSLKAAYGAQGGALLTPQQQGQILKDVVQNQAKTDQTLGKMLPFMMTRATMGVPDPSAPGGTHRASFPVQAQRAVGSTSAVASYRSWAGSDRLGGIADLDKETKSGKKAQKESTKAVQENTKQTKKLLKEQKQAKREMKKTANDILKKHGNTPAGRAAMIAAFPTTSANVLDKALAKAEQRSARREALSTRAGRQAARVQQTGRAMPNVPQRVFAMPGRSSQLAIESSQSRDARLRAEEARREQQQSRAKITDRRGGMRALSAPIVNLAETSYDKRLRENSQNMQRTAQTMAMRASAASIASSEALSENAKAGRAAIQEMTRQSQRPSVARFGAAPEGAGAFRRGFARLTRPIRSGIDSGLGAMQRSAYGVAPGTGWDARRGAIQNVGVNPYSGGTMMAASQMFRQSGMQILRNQVEGVSKSFSNLSNGMKGFGRGIKTVGQLLMPGATSWARFDKGAGPLFFGGGGMGGMGGGGAGFIGPRLPDGSTTTKSAPTFFRGGYVGDEKQGSKLTRGVQRGGGMAGMAMMMGSMIPMMNQDQEGKFMGVPATGAMMGAMGGGMLLSMVSGMSGPVIAAVLGIAAAATVAGVAIYKWRDGLDSSAKSAADLGANLGVTANAATKMAKVLQTSTPAQRKTDLQLGLVGEAREEAFGEFGQFLETEVGQSFIKGLEEAASPERFKMLSDYLRTAVATGLMDSQQAQSFAKVVASSIGDAFLGIRVASQLGNQKTGFSAMQVLAEERLAAVSQSAALGAIRTGETVTIEQAGEGIGASLQVIGDFSNVIAMAREDYQNGVISFNEMTAAVDNARIIQSEYNKILSDSLSQGDDRGAVRQALKDQLVASGLLNPEEFEAAESSIKNIASEQAKRRVGESSSAVTLGAMSLGFDLLKAGPFGLGGEILKKTLPFPGKEGLTGSAALDPREIAAESMSKRIEDDLKALYASMIQDGMNKADALAIAQAVGEDDKLAEIYQKLLEQQLGPIEAAATSMSLRGRMFEGQEAAAADRRGSAEYVSSQLAQKYVLQGRGNIADFQAFEAALPEGRELEILQSVAKLTTEKFKQYVSDFTELNAILGDADTAALVSESQAYKNALDQGRNKEFLSSISSAKEEFGQDFESVYNFIIKSNVPDPEAKLNELTEVAGRFKREVPPVITTTLGIEVTGEGVGASMDEWGPFIDGILELAPAIEALPEGVQEFGARFIMDMSSGEKKIADPKTFLKNLQNVKDTFEKMKTSKTEVKKTLAFQLIQTMENQDGTPITRAQFDEAYASLIDRFGEGVVKNLPPDVYTKVLALEIDASQLEEQAAGLEAAASKLAGSGLLGPREAERMAQQAAALRASAAAIRASASSAVLAANAGGGPTKPPGGGSPGGGDKQKNFIEELRDRVKELGKVNKFITRIIAGNAPAFKNFVAGPFAPEFLQFLEQQGEEAVKLLGKNAKKFKKVYNDFIKEQSISNSIALKIQRQFNKKEVQLSNERQNFLSGFTGTTAQRESIMSRMGEEDFRRFLEYRAMTKKERKKLNVEGEFQQLQKNYNQLARQAPKLAANDQLETFRDNITASKEEIQTLRALMARGFSATFAQQLIDSGVGLELLTKGTAKARQELAKLIADARQLNINQADFQIEANYDTQSQEIEKTYSILKLIPGANQNIIQGIIGMGIAAGSLPSQIMKAANAFSMLQARANLVRDAFSKNTSLIDAAVSGFQAQIEKINRTEIRPIELSIKAIEGGVREFEKQVRSLQKTIRPLEKEVKEFEKQIKEFEKQIKPLEKQIKAYDKQIKELQKTIRPFEKENEALQEVEKEITKEFEKREKALDKIEKINSRIAAQQRAQLSMAQAIAEGDIYAVAAAMQQYRAEQAQMNAEQTRDALKEGFENRREEITKKIEENEKRIKETNEQIEGIQERIEAIQENIESIQERIEERQERIAAINENIADIQERIADIQERIADEQDRIRDLQEQIEASKERQLALEEKIYKLQLLKSMLETASQIRDAVASGDPEMAQILQGQLGAQRDIASGMDFSDLGINTEGIFNLVAQAINPERIAEAVKTQITAGLLNILDSMGIVANNWVATGTTHMAEMKKIFGEMSRMSQEELSKFSPGMQAFLQAIKDKTIEFPKTAEELQAALVAYGVKGSDMVQLLMAAEGLGIIKKVDETGENATTNVEGAERRGKKNIDKEAEAIGKSAANLGKKVADAEREFEKGNITFRQAALRILGAMAEAIGSAAIAKVDTGGFNNALKTISTALQTTITEFSSTLSGTLDVILLIGNKFKDNVAAIEGISDDFSGIMEKVSEGFDNILTNVSNEFGVIGADFNAKFQGLMSSLVDAFGESIKTEFGRIVTALQTFTNESDGLPFILRGILTALSGFTTAVSNAVGILSEFTRVATDEITRVKLLAIGEIQNQERISVSNITKEAERLTPRYAGGMIKAYAMGGKIKGYPMGGKIPYAIGGVAGDGGRDSVPAILTPGEFVVRKSMVKKYGQPLFESINQGSFAMPRYNMPESRPTNIQTVMSTTSINAPVYNTYDMDFAINGTNASADEIANKVMFKMRQVQNQGIRSNRGY
jgi:TP901 family phage tail tape measure protein